MDKLRREYTDAGLDERDLDANPFKQFEQWFQEAIDAKIDLPDAMTLATATSDGYDLRRGLYCSEGLMNGDSFFTRTTRAKRGRNSQKTECDVGFLLARIGSAGAYHRAGEQGFS